MNYLASLFARVMCAVVLLSTAMDVDGAQTQDIAHTPVANLHLHQNTTWQHILPIPSTSDHLLIDQQGHFHRLNNGVIDNTPFFSLADISQNATKITAVVFHPNFSLRDQIGFHTFYTAHVEPLNTKRRYLRVQDTNATLTHDVIVTEWKTLNKTVDLDSRREVIRLGVPSEQTHIKQLAFSPFTKSWNDEFGFLYLALNHDTKHHTLPLYSGAMLRIDPKKSGLRSYTVPTSNPFIKQDGIANELFIIGLQQFEQFTWPHKDSHSFLALHHYQDQQQLTLIKANDDFRQHAPNKVLYLSDEAIAPKSLTAYRGRDFAHLWGTSLFLKPTNGQWALHSLAMPNINEANPIPSVQWQYQTSGTEPSQLAILSNDNDNDTLFVFDATTSLLNQLTMPSTSSGTDQTNSSTKATTNSNTSSTLHILFIMFGTILCITVAYFVRKKALSARYIVNQQFSRLQISESKQHLALFKRHEKEAELELDINKISLCTLTLNKKPLLTVSAEHPLSNAKEVDVREKCNNERREKMISGRLRQLNVEITDSKGHIYPICAYLRKGDNRVTRKKFGEIIEEVLDLCWLLSQTIAETETRSHIPVQVPEKKVLLKSVPRHQKSTMDTSATHTQQTPQTHLPDPTEPVSQNQQQATQPGAVQSGLNPQQSDTIDTNLVTALEKLAKLKEQGVLTEEEFTQAKQKVMIGLLK